LRDPDRQAAGNRIAEKQNLRSKSKGNDMLNSVAIPTQCVNPMEYSFRGFTAARPVIFLLVCFCLYPACADIYTYTDSDGKVYLTNEHENKHYQVLVAAPSVHAEEAPLAETRKTSPCIARKIKYDKMVEEVARIYGLDSALLHAVITVESRYNPNAISKKGASGLMQLMPNTARRYGVVDSLDPVQNLHGGAKYLRDMLILFNSDVSLAVAAYNAGETAVVRHGNRIPPFPETMDYVPKVMSFYREYRADRPRLSDALAVKGMVRSLTPGGASPANVGNAYINAFLPRKNL
jgi:hypothetical protein